MLNPKPRHTQLDAPPAGPKVTPLKRLGANDRIRVIVCAVKFYGMMVHWSGRSRPHTEPRERCDGCRHENAMKWYGWLHVCDSDSLHDFFIEFTAEGHDRALKAMGGQVVRGSKLLLFREGSKLRATIHSDRIGDYCGEKGPFPTPKNPSATLSKLWNCLVVLDD